MEIRDIIQSDRDRLFIVDPECYIIFTGDSTQDEQPFIRIGNWQDMPVELIPLIENIIITDGIPGNPSHEQFNIDVRNLGKNRYIGSENIVRRFLDYQRIFGLDLTNAIIVNIEKDIPELSQEKNISGKNHFIGVFYRDGNFKTVHNESAIMDLKDAENQTLTATAIQSRMSEIFQKCDRYDGSGMIILQHNPLFYHRGYLTSYLFPSRYLKDFSRLEINPLRIKNIIFPSGNYLNLSRFLKWKHINKGNITVFSDHEAQFQLIKGLFRNCTMNRQSFQGLQYNSGDGLTVTGYNNSYNVRISYKQGPYDDDVVNIAFVKGTSGIQKILSDDVDAVFIEYSVYEETSLLFKSTVIPVAIINDRNRNIAPILGSGITLLHHGVPYEIKKINSLEAILERYSPIPGLSVMLTPESAESIEAILEKLGGDQSDETEYQRKLYNLRSILRAMLNATGNRKLFQQIKSLIQSIDFHLKQEKLFSDDIRTMIDLVIFNNYIYTFITEAQPSGPPIFVDEIETIHRYPAEYVSAQIPSSEKIITDRLRLMKLLECYREARTVHAGYFNEEVEKLARAIEDRKNRYAEDLHEEPAIINGNGVIPAEKITSPSYQSDADRDANGLFITAGETGLPRLINRVKQGFSAAVEAFQTMRVEAPWKLAGISSIVLLVLVLSVILLLTHGDIADKNIKVPGKNGTAAHTGKTLSPDKAVTGPVTKSTEILTAEQIKTYDKIPVNFKSVITDTDIYRYANRVAVRNGYNEIAVGTMQGKDPHWIFPSNVFLLLDGEQIIVVQGDTLWDIARRKLMETDILFYQTVTAMRKARGNERDELQKKAEGYAFSQKHRIILQDLLKK